MERVAATSGVGAAAGGVSGGPAVLGLVVLALGLISEYRVRVGVSASIAELCAYVAVACVLLERPNATQSAGARRLWAALVVLGLLLAGRAIDYRLGRMPDVESPFSHIRDVCVPLVLVLVLDGRVHFSRLGRGRVAAALLVMGTLAGMLGISQFFTGGPYLYDGISIIHYKTEQANQYWLAQLLHLDVEHLARGFYGFSISYAASMVLPAVVAFALMLRGPRRRRIVCGLVFAVCYAGIYLSFSRSIITILPVACFLTWRAVGGKLRGSTCVAVVAGYVGFAFVMPLVHRVGGADLNTLDSRIATVFDYFGHVRRDPSVLLLGSPVASWRQWNSLNPHNWVVDALLLDGVPAGLLRVGLYLTLFVRLYPVRRGRETEPLRAGLWCASYAVLLVVGETEPYNGISEYLVAGFGLALLAASPALAVPAVEPRLHVIEGGMGGGAGDT